MKMISTQELGRKIPVRSYVSPEHYRPVTRGWRKMLVVILKCYVPTISWLQVY